MRELLAGRLARFFEPHAGGRPALMSQREFARRTGIPRSTLQDFLARPDAAREGTFQRIVEGARRDNIAIERQGVTTLRVDRPLWDQSLLGDTAYPPQATAVRFVLEDSTYSRGYRSSGWFDADEGSVEDIATLHGLDAGQIVRVVFDVA